MGDVTAAVLLLVAAVWRTAARELEQRYGALNNTNRDHSHGRSTLVSFPQLPRVSKEQQSVFDSVLVHITCL